MKKFTKALLALSMAAAMVVPAALSVSAAELTAKENEAYSGKCGCGFMDGNIRLTTTWDAATLKDLAIEVNGKPGYWNNTYKGYQHCGGTLTDGWVWLGVVGVDLVKGENTNTLKLTDKGGNTYTQEFSSDVNALGTSYAKVVADKSAKTVTAEIIFNTDPKLAVGATIDGRAHDDHGNVGKFTVTAYDAASGLYTIKASDYTTNFTLMEFTITAEGTYKDYWFAASTNAVMNNTTFIGDSQIVDASTKVALSNPAVTVDADGSSFSDAARLFDSKDGSGTDGAKIEGNWPGTMTITFEAADGAKPSYLVFYTDDDGSWQNRAPKTVTISASNDNTNWTTLKENVATGVENYNNAAFAIEVMADAEYKYFKVQISEKLGDQGGYFQLEEIVMLEGDKVTGTSREKVENLIGEVQYNGTAPKAPEQKPEDKPEDKPVVPTGDAMVVLATLAVVSLAGVAIVSKKRCVR